MSRILKASAVGAALAALSLGAVPALASPPAVYVRVEGAGGTLLAQTLTPTSARSTVAGKACPGSSAAGALDAATSGNWSGSYDPKYHDFLIGTILGETPGGNDYWTFFINGRLAPAGACSTKLHAGDHELWFDCIADASFNCTNNPLALSVPARIRLGAKVHGSVGQLDGAGHRKPIAGAAVTGAGIAAVSAGGGGVTFLARRAGFLTLQAAKSGATPSDPVAVCVYRSAPSECTSPSSGPAVHIAEIREHHIFRTGPRRLHGTAGPDPAGITDVSLSLARRTAGGRCSYFDADRAAWRKRACSRRAPLFSIGASQRWSYLLPSALTRGRYRLSVIATDGNGRRTRFERGVSELDFEVAR